MPLRNEALLKPVVIVRKKRPSTSTTTALPAGVAPKPVQPQRDRQLRPPPSTAPTPPLPGPTTIAQASAEQQNPQQPLLHQWCRDRDEFLAVLRKRWPQA